MKVVKSKAQRKERRQELGKKVLTGVKQVLDGVIEVTPLSVVKDFFDTDKDGQLTTKDLKGIAWVKLCGSVAGLAILIRLNIINLSDVVTLIKALMN